jgi:hypothetical protein
MLTECLNARVVLHSASSGAYQQHLILVHVRYRTTWRSRQLVLVNSSVSPDASGCLRARICQWTATLRSPMQALADADCACIEDGEPKTNTMIPGGTTSPSVRRAKRGCRTRGARGKCLQSPIVAYRRRGVPSLYRLFRR